MDDLLALILTYNRADRVRTIRALRKHGYTGPVKLLVSDDDPQLERYREIYGEDVVVFSKADYRGSFDMMDNFERTDTVTFARNASYDAAERLGYRYFLQLDDDYTHLRWFTDGHGGLGGRTLVVKNLGAILEAFLDFYRESSVDVLAFAQTGDYCRLGGVWKTGAKRKAMNWMLCSTDRRVRFDARLNDDVTTYLRYGGTGRLFLTLPHVVVYQALTQSQPGGLTGSYRDFGTYVKSFYSVMARPDCTIVSEIGHVDRRPHHRITWKRAVPKIVAPVGEAPCPSEP